MGVRAFEILDKKYSKNYGNLESALSYDDSAEKISRKKNERRYRRMQNTRQISIIVFGINYIYTNIHTL